MDHHPAVEKPYVDPSGGLLGFFLGEGDVVERCMRIEGLREHLSDGSFVKALRATAEKAKKAKTPEEIAEVTRGLMRDPRMTQAAMAGAGVNLEVSKEDMKKAEREGDVEKPSPLKVDDMALAAKEEDRDRARAHGSEAYATKDYAKAVAWWARAVSIDRTVGKQDDHETCAACYANVAQALLKLDHPKRAEQAATRALEHARRWRDDAEEARAKDVFHLDTGRRQRGAPRVVASYQDVMKKAYFRRALARETLRDFTGALRDVDNAGDDPAIHKLRKRLAKLAASESKAKAESELRRREERDATVKRAAGVQLKDAATGGSSSGYVSEQDFTSLCVRELRGCDVEIDLKNGASVRIVSYLESLSSASVTVNQKRGKRALFYDLDVHFAWEADPAPDFDLSPEDGGPRTLKGQVRLYNVSHDTVYNPGQDPNVAYMYQLGYQGIKADWFDGNKSTDAAPRWAALLIDGAHDLYEALAHFVDAIIRDLKAKLDT